MISYDFPLYRPPAEADSIIIQATLGCSHNQCSFCSMYKSKSYQVRPIDTVAKEIEAIAYHSPHATKVFLADGDALALPTPHLLELLRRLQKSFAKLRRVSVYATAQNLLEKSPEELKTLQENKLSLLYFGLETGNAILLEKISKGVDGKQIQEALMKAANAQMKTSVTDAGT